MAAEVVLSLVVSKLGNMLIQEAVFLYEVHNQVEWLERELRRMRCFLDDASAKRKGDERVKNWVGDVRDVAYDAEDVIDTFMVKLEWQRRNGFKGFLRRFIFFSSGMLARHEVGKDIERLKIKLREISESRLVYGIKDIGEGSGGSTSSGSASLRERRTSPLAEETEVVGFEENIQSLVWRLIEGEPRRSLISIVGMGGLGKTTLAQKVYRHEDVKKHFDSCAWVYVSQEFSASELLQVIIKSSMALTEEELEKVEKMSIVELRKKLFEHLKERRYLIVLDDMWNTEAWDALKASFPDMNNGSRVLVTTRNREVVSHADARCFHHELQFLREDESWELFCKKMFQEQGTGCPPNLERLGRQIVEKCHGLPLAIVVLGGLLSRKEETLSEWEKVLKSLSWQFAEGQAQFSSILALSFDDLPSYLKLCFLYLGLFPEDYELPAKKLIQLWVAEGLVQQRGDETWEEVAEDCLEELIQRSMIQVAKRSSSGGVKSCRVHDLLRDLSISKAKDDGFLDVHHGNSNPAPPSRARRLAIHHCISKYSRLNHSTPNLRSLSCFTMDEENLRKNQERFLYRGFKLLRVLDLHGLSITKLPDEIGHLIHLRYLGCTGTRLEALPSTIGNLCNLQTLDLRSYYKIHIPETIWKMQRLRHLRVKLTRPRTSPVFDIRAGWTKIAGHPRVGCLSDLQTLTYVQARGWIEYSLGKLTSLRKLALHVDFRVHEKPLFDFIARLGQLRSLTLAATLKHKIPPLMTISNHLHLCKLCLSGRLEKLPDCYEFPPNLNKLTLVWSMIGQDQFATLEKLINLRILKLLNNSYVGKEMVCSAGGFPRLESLQVEYLDELEVWSVEQGALPSLLHLRIVSCGELKRLPGGLKHVKTLKKLDLWGMPKELKDMFKQKKGEDWNVIRDIPSISMK